MIEQPFRRHSLYALLVIALLCALLAFAYVGHFTRYMADDYCLAAELHELGFARTQMRLYTGWTGRYSYSFLISLAEMIGTATVPVGPLLGVACWLAAAIWSLYQIAFIARWSRRLLFSCVIGELIVFAMLNGADNIVQSFYWQGGLVNYVAPLILLTVYVGIVSYAIRKQVQGGAALWLAVLCAGVTFFAGGFTEAYGFLQAGALLLALLACYKFASDSFRRLATPLIVAGLVGAVIAICIVVFAPGNKFRVSHFAPRPNLIKVTMLSLYYAAGFIVYKIYLSPLTTLLLVLLPARLGWDVHKAGSSQLKGRKTGGLLFLIPVVGFFLIFICFATGVYGTSGALPERARFIPQFVFVCIAVCWGYLVGAALIKWLSLRERKLSRLRIPGSIAVTVFMFMAPLLATWRIMKLVPRAEASASIWDQTDRDIRAARAQGSMNLTVPAVDDVETRLGARRTELQLEHDVENWKNKCVARYYQIASIKSQ
jgi:hypothetical protein